MFQAEQVMFQLNKEYSKQVYTIITSVPLTFQGEKAFKR